MSRWYQKPWMTTLAFFVVLMIVGYVISSNESNSNQRIYQTQLEGCYRGNILRHENNVRGDYNQRIANGLRAFLASAATARRANYKVSHEKADKVAFSEYQEQLTLLKDVHYERVPIINCLNSIIKP